MPCLLYMIRLGDGIDVIIAIFFTIFIHVVVHRLTGFMHIAISNLAGEFKKERWS